MRLILILALCLPAVAQGTLVQSIVQGTASSSSNPTSLATSAAGFSGNTVAHHLLVAVAYYTQIASVGNFGNGHAVGAAIDNTHGFTFTSAICSTEWLGGPGGAKVRQGGTCLWYQANASAIPNTATTTLTCNYSTAATTWSATCELHLYEFDINNSLDGGETFYGQTVSTPFNGVSKTTTNATDLIFAVYSADTASASYATAGSGYTLGLATTVAGIGQPQYQYFTSVGSQSLAFAGASSNDGVGQALAFKQIAASPSSVARHKGYVF